MRSVSLVGALFFLYLSPASAQEPGEELAPEAEAVTEGAGGLTEPTPSPDGSYASEGGSGEVPPPPEDSEFGANRYPTGLGSAADDTNLQIPSRIATRLRVLDADFAYLAGRGGNHIVDGVLSIVSGGLSVSLGFIIDEELLQTYLFTFGGASIVRGIIDLILDPDASDSAIEYGHMPMTTMQEVHDRLAFGEAELESLADLSRLSRILDASINIASGLAIVPLYLGPKEFEVDTFGAIVLVGAGVSVVTGVISLFTQTEAERRWDAYDELRARLEGEESDEDEDGGRAEAEGDPGFDGAEALEEAEDAGEVDASFGLSPAGAGVSFGARF
jgi:hypothetical protein